jgi:hypothetical protein
VVAAFASNFFLDGLKLVFEIFPSALILVTVTCGRVRPELAISKGYFTSSSHKVR